MYVGLLYLTLYSTDSLTMTQAYPQGRPQEDPRVPLPWYVLRTLAGAGRLYTVALGFN
jgi:hypothetical protein